MVTTIVKIFITIILFSLLNNCSGFKPLYKENINVIYKLQNFSIVTDEKKISNKIKKKLLELFPANKNTKYIIKIEGKSETSGTVSDTTRKISRYKTKVSAKIKLFHRYPEYDKLIYSFEEKRDASYSLILNNIRSTLASNNAAEETSVRLLSEEIYKRILVYLSKN